MNLLFQQRSVRASTLNFFTLYHFTSLLLYSFTPLLLYSFTSLPLYSFTLNPLTLNPFTPYV